MSQKSAYLSSVVGDAIEGDPNSFALIYLMTYEDIYKNAHLVFSREYDIQDVMFQTYVIAYKRLSELQNPLNLNKWVNTIFESQLAFQLKKQKRSINEYYIAQRKLFKKRIKSTLSEDNAAQLLESVFMFVGSEPNSIPLESLKAYDSYRNSRTYLQRFLLLVAILLILIVPFALMEPTMTIEYYPEETTNNQAHYLIKVKSVFPVSTVIGNIGGEDVTIMIDGDKIYNATCIKNGTLTVTAKCINNKSVTGSIEVMALDQTSPWVDSYYLENGNIVLVALDDGGSGVDPVASRIVKLSDGSFYTPISYDEETGVMVLPHFPNDCAFLLADKAGNEVTYTISFQ